MSYRRKRRRARRQYGADMVARERWHRDVRRDLARISRESPGASVSFSGPPAARSGLVRAREARALEAIGAILRANDREYARLMTVTAGERCELLDRVAAPVDSPTLFTRRKERRG